jgi:hypothetical protein
VTKLTFKGLPPTHHESILRLFAGIRTASLSGGKNRQVDCNKS